MRTWLFYKRIGEKTVEFRKVDAVGIKKPHTMIVPPLNEPVNFDNSPTEKEIERFVRQCGWVAEPPREFNHPVAQIVLNGEW